MRFAAVLLLAVCALSCRNGEPEEHLPVTGLPGWLTVAETNGAGRPGVWRMDEDGTIRLTRTSNSGQTYNLLLADEQQLGNVGGERIRLGVRLRAEGGEEDQGGGLVWRARGPDDYYVARWNPLEDNLRLYTVVGGKREPLASAAISADRQAWHSLEVTMQGERIEILFDGTEALQFEDRTFGPGGRVGLWTKADAATSFSGFFAGDV